MAAMSLYVMPTQNPYQRPFRIFAGIAVSLLLAILCIATWTPEGMNNEIRQILAWIAGIIVVVSIVVGSRLGLRQGLWKLKEGFGVEVSEGKLIQKPPGSAVVEIPLAQISSLQESRGGWLIVRGDEPKKHIAIPTEIVGLENLRREISGNLTVSELRIRLSPRLFLPSALFVLACIFLFASHSRAVVLGAGGAALLLHGFSIYSLRRKMQPTGKANLFTLTSVVIFLIFAWIVSRASERDPATSPHKLTLERGSDILDNSK
jgi:hypothetical protein